MQIGQKVECVDAAEHSQYPNAVWAGDVPVLGAIYTVTGIVTHPRQNVKCLLLAEIRNIDEHGGAYLATRFRPVTQRKTDISIFTEMLNKELV